jgi:hypothetical protein
MQYRAAIAPMTNSTTVSKNEEFNSTANDCRSAGSDIFDSDKQGNSYETNPIDPCWDYCSYKFDL